ncbi:MAG: hypothetical protein JWO13_624 [Acidobacteriales bacterium]|nr:hypothetical protein [Terriglobales bacterium]
MDFNKLKDQISDEDKQKLMEKAEELKKDFGNKASERFGFGKGGEQQNQSGIRNDASAQDPQTDDADIDEDETAVASTDIETEDDENEIDEESDEENAA